jgi:hypothetical protein
LEKIIALLLELTLDISMASRRISNPVYKKDSINQIDASFYHYDFAYRMEVKWRKRELDADDVFTFTRRIDNIKTDGIILSINGINDSAITEAFRLREEFMILLIDGGELELVLQGRISFADMVTIKRDMFIENNKSYHKIRLDNDYNSIE